MGVYFIEMSDLDAFPPARTREEQATWDVLFERPVSRVFGVDGDLSAQYFDPYGSAGAGTHDAQTLNRAWHTISAQWVYWRTALPDTTGASYPGPGTFGECTNYGVETIVYVPV